MRGLFIVFEGIDGCGKSTQSKLAASYLFSKSKYTDLYISREPTRFAKEIRNRLSKKETANAEWLVEAFVEDRKLHVKNSIEPSLNNGTDVLCDRYDFSTYAYQWAQGISFERIHELHKDVLVPDLTIVYDCPVEVAFSRRLGEGATSTFDKDLELLKKVKEKYLELKNKMPNRNIIIINSNRPVSEIFEDTKKAIDSVYKEK